jgi:hypothetical protein
MKRLSPTAVVVLVAFSVPVAVELRTVAAFVGVTLSTEAVILFETLVLTLIFGAYTLGQVFGETEDEAAS